MAFQNVTNASVEHKKSSIVRRLSKDWKRYRKYKIEDRDVKVTTRNVFKVLSSFIPGHYGTA